MGLRVQPCRRRREFTRGREALNFELNGYCGGGGWFLARKSDRWGVWRLWWDRLVEVALVFVLRAMVAEGGELRVSSILCQICRFTVKIVGRA